MNTSVNIHGATRDTRVLAGGFVVNIGKFYVYSGTIHKGIADLHLCGGDLQVKLAGFLVYTCDILV